MIFCEWVLFHSDFEARKSHFRMENIMARKQIVEGGKKNEIIEAAFQLFLENGYDGTTVRMIQKKVGSEVGLFYYYFKNKDDLFDHVLDYFFLHYKVDFASIIEHGRRNPCRIMTDFFEYVERETAAFRERYADNIHRTMRWAIREHTLDIIEPYLLEVVKIQSEYYQVKPPLSLGATAVYLTHGVGSSILHEEEGRFLGKKRDMMHGVSLLMGMPEDEQELRIPHWANEEDMDSWMELLDSVEAYFPGLDKKQYKEQLKDYIANQEALVFRYEERVVAGLLFGRERGELDFLAVHEGYRKKGLAGRLVETMLAQFDIGTDISVITFREGDCNGEMASAFYESKGFKESELLEAFGYPCRRMVMTVREGLL